MTVMPTTSAPQAPHQPPTTGTAKRRHRWWRWVAGVLAVLLVLFLGAAWYFSGRIESGALTSTPEGTVPAYDDVEVVAVGADTLTLRKGPDAGPNFDARAVYALAWEGGMSHVGPAVEQADGTVIRGVRDVVGSLPTVGQLAALDSAYFLEDPTTLGDNGIEYSEVMVDERFPAWYFPAGGPAPSTMAILVHGQNASRTDMLRATDTLHAADIAVLDITYRNDVGTPPDPSGHLQYGVTEWQDLDAAVTWARELGANEVVLVGQSMGGAVIASYLEHSDQTDVVSRVVLDSPMLSLADVVENGARTAMPITGGAVPAPLIWAAERIASVRFDIDWSAVDYLDDTSWVTVPTLVIHGTADPRVPVGLAQELAAAEPDLVTLKTVPGALHVETWNFGPENWKSTVTTFLETTS